MKNAVLFLICCATVSMAYAQKETFDLTNYTVPGGWKKEIAENSIGYTTSNIDNNTWCRINIVKSTISKGTIDEDFENEWKELVVKNYKPADAPQLNEMQESPGWKIKAGAAKFVFNNSEAMVFLTTATGYNRCTSIVAATNSEAYLKDIEALLASVDLITPEITATPTPVALDDTNSILGTWGANASGNSTYRMNNGIVNYISRQYTFNADGGYSFISKAFDPLMENMILGKESGTYQISGTAISINPKKSVLQAWSRKNATDHWGKLINTQNISLEKANYQFTKHYFSGTQVWNLVLQTDKATNRDGPFSGNKTFSNAWYYGAISFNNKAIELPEEQPTQQPSTPTNTAILGSWGIGTTIASAYHMHINEGNIVKQYTFNADGTYGFYIKTFRYQLDHLLFSKETGTYLISGDNLIITPQKAVTEAWSKKDGTDNWGKLLSSDKEELEKTTYAFSTADFGLGRVLILKAATTKRDGHYNNSKKDAWYYPSKSNLELIKLPN